MSVTDFTTTSSPKSPAPLPGIAGSVVELPPDLSIPAQSLPEPTPDDSNWQACSEIGQYRAGFVDACDGLTEQSRSYAYQDGYGSGLMFRERISATRQPLEGHFPGWPYDARNFPKALKAYSYRTVRVELRLPRFSHGGARRGANWRELAVLDKPPTVAEVDHALDRSRIERADPGDQQYGTEGA